MRVLSIHNFYYVTGGSDRCFFDLNELLASKGHEVIAFSTKDPRNLYSDYQRYFSPQLDFDVSRKSLKQIKSFLNMLYSFSSKRSLENLINYIYPDVAHLHNIYGRISPSILPLLKKHHIPVVQTIHDSKYVCPNHRMFANGSICEECRGGQYYKAILKRCTHGSAVFGAALALEAYIHRWINIYDKYIDAFICPSFFLKDKLVGQGIDPRKVFVLPNFVSLPNSDNYLNPNIDGLYLGSLIPEKGVEVLIRSLSGLEGGRFKVIGDGYMKSFLKKIVREKVPSGGPSIEFTGHLNSQTLRKEISMTLMVIVPSVWYENSPMAILEAFAQGKPVIASRIGGIPEMVIEGETGLLFEPGNSFSLREKMSAMLSNRDRTIQMGKNAREWVRENRSPENYFRQLMSIYSKVGARA